MRGRIALGAAWAGLGASTSYVVQRLVVAWYGDAHSAGVIASAHIPYYWRVDGAILQGVLLGALVAGFARQPERFFLLTSRVAWVLVPTLIIASLAVP